MLQTSNREEKMNQLIIKCQKCKTEIIQDHPNRRLCLDCKKNKNRIKQKIKYSNNPWKKRKEKTKKKCVVCGKKFLGFKSITCSHNCNNIHRRMVTKLKKNLP